jgi:hypothetical protein
VQENLISGAHSPQCRRNAFERDERLVAAIDNVEERHDVRVPSGVNARHPAAGDLGEELIRNAPISSHHLLANQGGHHSTRA